MTIDLDALEAAARAATLGPQHPTDHQLDEWFAECTGLLWQREGGIRMALIKALKEERATAHKLAVAIPELVRRLRAAEEDLEFAGAITLPAPLPVNKGETVVAVGAKRWEQMSAIVRDLAASEKIVSTGHGESGCYMCGAPKGWPEGHMPECLIRRAVEVTR